MRDLAGSRAANVMLLSESRKDLGRKMNIKKVNMLIVSLLTDVVAEAGLEHATSRL